MKLWDVQTGRQIRTLLGLARGVQSVAFSPDGWLLASGGWDQTIRVWERAEDAKTWKLRHVLRDPTNGVESVAFSPDGRRLA